MSTTQTINLPKEEVPTAARMPPSDTANVSSHSGQSQLESMLRAQEARQLTSKITTNNTDDNPSGTGTAISKDPSRDVVALFGDSIGSFKICPSMDKSSKDSLLKGPLGPSRDWYQKPSSKSMSFGKSKTGKTDFAAMESSMFAKSKEAKKVPSGARTDIPAAKLPGPPLSSMFPPAQRPAFTMSGGRAVGTDFAAMEMNAFSQSNAVASLFNTGRGHTKQEPGVPSSIFPLPKQAFETSGQNHIFPTTYFPGFSADFSVSQAGGTTPLSSILDQQQDTLESKMRQSQLLAQDQQIQKKPLELFPSVELNQRIIDLGDKSVGEAAFGMLKMKNSMDFPGDLMGNAWKPNQATAQQQQQQQQMSQAQQQLQLQLQHQLGQMHSAKHPPHAQAPMITPTVAGIPVSIPPSNMNSNVLSASSSAMSLGQPAGGMDSSMMPPPETPAVKDSSASSTCPKSQRKPRKTIPDKKIFVTKADMDVLFGRGGESNYHPGNKIYRKLVDESKPQYLGCDKNEKTKVAQTVVDQIHGQGGRFLDKDKESGCWYVALNKVARTKVGQALRDRNTPEARAARRAKYGC